MAVILRKTVINGPSTFEVETYEPPGRLSKDERVRADRLDEFLRNEMPKIREHVLAAAPEHGELVRRWYLLGKKLREIVSNRELVSGADVDSGIIWSAIWYFLPDSLKPAGSTESTDYSQKRHKRKDHLSLCFEIARFEWCEVAWLKRWDDWNQIAFRPGLLRDPRILNALGNHMLSLDEYPSRGAFRNIAKMLGEKFPTRRFRDSSFFTKDDIQKAVTEAIARAASR